MQHNYSECFKVQDYYFQIRFQLKGAQFLRTDLSFTSHHLRPKLTCGWSQCSRHKYPKQNETDLFSAKVTIATIFRSALRSMWFCPRSSSIITKLGIKLDKIFRAVSGKKHSKRTRTQQRRQYENNCSSFYSRRLWHWAIRRVNRC